MSIANAIHRAYRVAQDRKWDKIYYALDLHGTVIDSTYDTFTHSWINDEIQPILKELSALPETEIVLWSSLRPEEQPQMIEFFESQGIRITAFNKNHLIPNTKTGYFNEKFYMSVIIDDKAGFDVSEWPTVLQAVREYRRQYGFSESEAAPVV